MSFAYCVFIKRWGLFGILFMSGSGRRSVWGGWRGSAERWDRDPSSALNLVCFRCFYNCLCCQIGHPVVSGTGLSFLMFWYILLDFISSYVLSWKQCCYCVCESTGYLVCISVSLFATLSVHCSHILLCWFWFWIISAAILFRVWLNYPDVRS